MLKFKLKNPLEITPWGKENNLMLHWFGLTDSFYWLELGERELLRYSVEFVEFYKLDRNLPYVDYHFSRIFQDITSIIRNVLTLIPDEIFDNIRTFANFDSYLDSLSGWLEHQWNETDEDFDNIYLPARQWIDDRRLDFGYLIGAPRVYLFRNDDDVYIRWISEYKDKNGIIMWESTKGEYIMNSAKFVSELQLTIRNFALAMDNQVQYVLNNPIENVIIDKSTLLKNHEEFLEEVKSYEKILPFASDQADWENVLSKLNIINQAFR